MATRNFPDYRYFTKADDTKILNNRMRRVTDTSIPEDEAFRAVEKDHHAHVEERHGRGQAQVLARVLL
jgi:deoxyhypusine synthase